MDTGLENISNESQASKNNPENSSSNESIKYKKFDENISEINNNDYQKNINSNKKQVKSTKIIIDLQRDYEEDLELLELLEGKSSTGKNKAYNCFSQIPNDPESNQKEIKDINSNNNPNKIKASIEIIPEIDEYKQKSEKKLKKLKSINNSNNKENSNNNSNNEFNIKSSNNSNKYLNNKYNYFLINNSNKLNSLKNISENNNINNNELLNTNLSPNNNNDIINNNKIFNPFYSKSNNNINSKLMNFNYYKNPKLITPIFPLNDRNKNNILIPSSQLEENLIHNFSKTNPVKLNENILNLNSNDNRKESDNENNNGKMYYKSIKEEINYYFKVNKIPQIPMKRPMSNFAVNSNDDIATKIGRNYINKPKIKPFSQQRSKRIKINHNNVNFNEYFINNGNNNLNNLNGNIGNNIINNLNKKNRLHKIKIERGMMSSRFADKIIHKLNFNFPNNIIQNGVNNILTNSAKF